MNYVFDIDGTICNTENSDYENSKPITSRIDFVNSLYDDGHHIVFHTARGMGRSKNSFSYANTAFYELTRKQLLDWGVKFHELHLGKPAGDVYVDDKGKKCSWHLHRLKDEVFYLKSGKLKVYYSDSDDLSKASVLILNPGENFHVYRGLRHQMLALEDSELFEFSTTHFDSDSYRIIKGD